MAMNKYGLEGEIYWAPEILPNGRYGRMFKDSPTPPPPPDYEGAARAQGAANVDAARASAKLSNPNVITPYGRQTVTYGNGSRTFDEAGYNKAMDAYNAGASPNVGVPTPIFSEFPGSNANPNGPQTPNPFLTPTAKAKQMRMPTRDEFMVGGGDQDVATVIQSLNPESQALLDQDNRIKTGLGQLAEGGIGRVGELLGTQFDMSKVPGQAQAGQEGWDKAYQSIIDRNQPNQDHDRAMLETQLANQGIVPGSEAYTNAMRDQAMRENDFRLGAQGQATGQEQAQYGMDQSSRQDAITQQAYLRQLPLNEINALRSGAQIVNPTFQQYQGSNVTPAPIFAGAQAQGQADQGIYNAKAASSANDSAATTKALGSVAMMGAMMM